LKSALKKKFASYHRGFFADSEYCGAHKREELADAKVD